MMLLAFLSASGQEVQVLKLFGTWSKPPLNYFIGNSQRQALAISDKWVLAGTPSADEQANNQGAVQVFNALTGAWVRKLLPPLPIAADQHFGNACAIAGNQAIIQADANVGPRRVYVYDLATGKLVRELSVPGVLDTHYFGESLAVWGDKILVGASGTDNYRGAVYAFSLKTGAFISKIQPPDTVAFDYFGQCIATDGSYALISAPSRSGGKGGAYLYELRSGALVKTFAPAAASTSDHAGYRVALSGSRALLTSFKGNGRVIQFNLFNSSEKELIASDDASGGLGATLAVDGDVAIVGSSEGKAYVFDLLSSSTTEMSTLSPPDYPGYFSRNGVAMANGTVLCSGESDDTLGNGSGAVYMFRTITRPLTLTKVAARGDFAPAAADTTFNVIGDAYINPNADVGFLSTLLGTGSNKGKDNGLWSTMLPDLPGYPPGLTLTLKSRDKVLGTPVLTVDSLRFNRPYMALYIARRGPNDAVIMKDNGFVTERLYQNAFATPDLAYPTLVQSHHFDLAAYSITLKNGVNGVNAGNDSGVILLKPSEPSQGNVLDRVRESVTDISAGLVYGQFTGRVALYYDTAVYSAAVQSLPANNQAIFRKKYQVGTNVVAQKGFPAPSANGALYSAFIGESTDDTYSDTYRATIGAPATAATNEGLWVRVYPSPAYLALRKGDTVPGTNGAKIASFIQFWATYNQTLALVKLSGVGVTSANDQALILYQTTANVAGTVLVLLREGDPASGCGTATIGVISRVEVDTFSGQYLVLATLAGAPVGSNQCLFRGASHASTFAGSQGQYLRLPNAVLRKGQLFSGRPSRVKSISLPATNLTAAGAGSTGLGTAMQYTGSESLPNPIVLNIEFENGVKQVLQGIP